MLNSRFPRRPADEQFRETLGDADGVREHVAVAYLLPAPLDEMYREIYRSHNLLGFSGGPPGDRTRDTLIKSQVLYH